jgi:hypothetical protein
MSRRPCAATRRSRRQRACLGNRECGLAEWKPSKLAAGLIHPWHDRNVQLPTPFKLMPPGEAAFRFVTHNKVRMTPRCMSFENKTDFYFETDSNFPVRTCQFMCTTLFRFIWHSARGAYSPIHRSFVCFSAPRRMGDAAYIHGYAPPPMPPPADQRNLKPEP